MKKGQSLVELMMFIGILAIFLPGLMTALVASREGRPQLQQRLQANTILKQTQEQVRSIREQGWAQFATITPGLPYHPATTNGTSWNLVSGIETLANSFTRQVVFENVIRDNNGNIVLPPATGTVDPSTTQATTTVSWTQPYSSSLSSSMYLTRFRDNITHPETTTADFTPGTTLGTKVDSTIGDGAVVLNKSAVNADWCSPSLAITPYTISGNGIGIAIYSVAGASAGQNNYSYITTGGNASSDSLFSLSITDPVNASLPVVTTYQHYNSNKDYGIYANNSYVFVTSDHPGLSVDIINKSNLTHAGYYAGSKPGYSVYTVGNTGYVTNSTKFDAFDIGTIKGSSSQNTLWSIPLSSSANGRKVIVSGNYAYIATSATSSSQQLQVVNLTTHAITSPPPSGAGSINSSKAGVDVAVLNNYAYLVTGYTSSAVPDVFIIDISTPGSPKVVGTANTYYSSVSMNPLGVATTPNGKIIVVGNGGYQYQVFDVSTPASPVHCGPQLQNPDGAQQITAVSTLTEADGDVFSYILATNGGSQQIQIIAGGAGGGGGYLSSGTFESRPFDPGYSTAFNRFIADINQSSPTTTIQMQVAVVNKVNGSCTDPGINYSGAYVGPAGISSQYFTSTDNSTIPGTIPFGSYSGIYTNPGQCFRYKLILSTTDPNQTPSFNDITVNYSP